MSANDKKLRVLIVHGPNLNLLGTREPDIYGTLTQNDIVEALLATGDDIELVQSNHEGDLIDVLHEAPAEFDGVILNPGAFTHYSYALYDAIRALDLPVVEVHLSDIHAREPFRATSVTAPACSAQFMGEGIESYQKALNFLHTQEKGK